MKTIYFCHEPNYNTRAFPEASGQSRQGFEEASPQQEEEKPETTTDTRGKRDGMNLRERWASYEKTTKLKPHETFNDIIQWLRQSLSSEQE